MNIKFKRLDELAQIQRRTTAGSAGFDVFSNGHYTIATNVRCLLDTGIAIQLQSDM